MSNTAKEIESGAVREIEPELRDLFTKVVERKRLIRRESRSRPISKTLPTNDRIPRELRLKYSQRLVALCAFNASVFGAASVWYFYFKPNVAAYFREHASR